jgi:serine/threonine protein phosphatase PrpC
MIPGIQTEQWRVLGRSVRGASHRRRNQVNQDAMLWDASNTTVAVAVADGHGSASCFRSDVGAKLAVEACIQLFGETAALDPPAESFAEAARTMPAALVSRWRAAVAAHLAAQPLTPSELASLNGRAAGPPWTIYGTTIVAVLALASHILYLQLGDGDILVVDESGAVTRPWPRDQRYLGVETASLCGPAPEDELRLRIQPLDGAGPVLVLLATDGYANSFRDDAGFLRTGSDVLEIVRREGLDKIDRDLESWLHEASEFGSGDDITVALISRESTGGAVDAG